ncbi:MAG TPA: TetR family transcriptional regulator [Arsenophonus nasoniae]
MNRLRHQENQYRLTGESVKYYRSNNKKKKLLLIDKLILLFGVLFVFYFITIVIKS